MRLQERVVFAAGTPVFAASGAGKTVAVYGDIFLCLRSRKMTMVRCSVSPRSP